MANATPVHAKPKTEAKKPLSKDAQKIKEEQAEKNVPVADDKQLMNVDQPDVPEANEAPAAPAAAGMAGTTTLADGTILKNH